MSDLEAFRFISRLRRLDHPRDCQRLFHDAIGRYGFDTFAMGELDLVDRGRSAFHIIDWPEDWRRFYVASGLIHHRSEEHTSELQSRENLVCRLLLEKK